MSTRVTESGMNSLTTGHLGLITHSGNHNLILTPYSIKYINFTSKLHHSHSMKSLVTKPASHHHSSNSLPPGACLPIWTPLLANQHNNRLHHKQLHRLLSRTLALPGRCPHSSNKRKSQARQFSTKCQIKYLPWTVSQMVMILMITHLRIFWTQSKIISQWTWHDSRVCIVEQWPCRWFRMKAKLNSNISKIQRTKSKRQSNRSPLRQGSMWLTLWLNKRPSKTTRRSLSLKVRRSSRRLRKKRPHLTSLISCFQSWTQLKTPYRQGTLPLLRILSNL